MSSQIEDRIVSIQFDNSSFERRMEQTLRSLDKLSESLRLADGARGFQNVSAAANKFDTSHMAGAIDGIAHRFTTMGIVGVTAIANLTTSALQFVKKVGGDILAPILSGGKSRAVNLEQAKFLFEGIGIDVQAGMASALKAVKGTAFGLDEAAKIAAQFGAAGIKAGDQMTGALRGVAGAAALTGVSFQEIGDIFASSAATGVVNNQDLQQFATRGLNAAAAIAPILGKTEAQVHEMASAGKLDFKTFADAMDKAFGKHATEANQTYTGSLANLHAAFSRLGASFFTPNLVIQRDLFNALTPLVDGLAEAFLPLINDFIVLKRIGTDKLIKGINNFLKGFDFAAIKLGIGGIAKGFVNIYQALKPLGNTFKAAFHEIFSGSASLTFLKLAASFLKFTQGIKIGGDTLKNFKSIFKGFFSVIEIGFTIFKEVVKTIGTIFQVLFPASKGFLTLGASTGDFLTNLNKALVAGGGITRFFEKLRDVIRSPAEAFKALGKAISDFFHGVNFASSGPIKALQDLRDKIFAFFHIKVSSDAIEKGLGRVGQRLDQLHNIWDKVQAAFHKVKDFLQPVLDYMTNWIKELGSRLAAAFHPGDFHALLDLLNAGLLGGIVVILKKFAQNGLKIDLTGGFLQKLRDSFNQLTNTLHAMQTQLKAQALEKIAIAIGILTLSLIALSLIDSDKLTKALLALSISFGQLIGALTLLDKLNFSASIVKLNGIAVAMGLIAGAAVILAVAITILSRLKLGALAKGLAGVGVGLGLLVAASRLVSDSAPQLVIAGGALVIIAGALLLLSASVKIFSKMSLGDLAKGLISVGVGLGLLVGALSLIPSMTAGLIAGSVAIGLMTGALLGLTLVVKIFSTMSAGELAKGFISIAIGLGLLVGALSLVTTNTAGLLLASAAMIGMAIAITIIARAVKLLGGIPMGELVKGILALTAVLLVLVVATNAMEAGIGGAAAILVTAVALRILVEVLKGLGQLSIAQIAVGILAIAAVLTVLGVAAALLIPVIPEMLALGIALALLGGAFALFGVGAALVAKAFEIMAKSGAAGAKGIVEAMKVILTALPTVEKAIVDFAIGFLKDILKAAPLLLRLIQAVLEQLIKTVIDLAPKIGKAVGVIITQIVKFVKDDSPRLNAAGFELLLNFLKGIRDNIGEIVTVVAEIVVNFLNALSDKVDEMADAVRHFIITVMIVAVERMTGIDLILGPAGRNAIGGFLKGLADKAKDVFKFFTELPGKILDIIKKALGINSPSTVFQKIGVDVIAGFLLGLTRKVLDVMKFFIELPIKILVWVGDLSSRLIQKGVQIITGFFTGVKNHISDVANWFRELPGRIVRWIPNPLTVLENVGHDIVTGLWNGIKKAKDWLIDRIKEMVSWLPSWAKKFLGISSPSKVMEKVGGFVAKGLAKGLSIFSPSKEMEKLGAQVPAGLLLGIRSMDREVHDSGFKLSAKLLDGFNEVGDINPTITPVLDMTKIQKDAGGIKDLFDNTKISPGVSFDTARHISTTKEQTTPDVTPVGDTTTINNFEQNNYSPKALSTNDIYKNTKSQFVLAKEKLAV